MKDTIKMKNTITKYRRKNLNFNTYNHLDLEVKHLW